MVGLRGPFGKGWPLDALHGKDVVIVAGGIGLAPLRPVIYWLLDHRDLCRRVVLCTAAARPRTASSPRSSNNGSATAPSKCW